MEETEVNTELESENPAVVSGCSVPNVYKTLSEGQQIKNEAPYMSILQPELNGLSVVIKTELTDYPLSEGLPVSKLNPEMSAENKEYDPCKHKFAIKTEAACCSVSDDQVIQTKKPIVMLNKVLLDFAERKVIETGLAGASANCGKVGHVDQMVKFEPMETFSETEVPELNHLDDSCPYSTTRRNTPCGASAHGNGHFCGRCHTQSGNLTLHKRTDTGNRRFVCDLCGKRFTRSDQLKVHGRVHTGERPYVCDLCGKAFTGSGNLKRHKRSHTGERPFVCNLCGKGFSQLVRLQEHCRIHSGERPYLCDLCGKRFTQKNGLKEHTRSHTGEKPYACDMCAKRFSHSRALKVHKRTCTHAREKSYSCDLCGKKFTRAGKLAIHKRSQKACAVGLSKKDFTYAGCCIDLKRVLCDESSKSLPVSKVNPEKSMEKVET